jgi:hypothetical protein
MDRTEIFKQELSGHELPDRLTDRQSQCDSDSVLLITKQYQQHGRSGELTDFERGLAIGCHISKKSVWETATLLKLPKSAAGDAIGEWKREGTTTTNQDWIGRV